MANYFEDYGEIQTQVNKVLYYSQELSGSISFREIDTKKLFSDWAANKQILISRFDNELATYLKTDLIYESPKKVRFELTEESKQRRLNDLITNIALEYQEIADFLANNKESFFENRVTKSAQALHAIIPEGMKLVKSLKYFFETSKKDEKKLLRKLQDEVSAVMNQDIIEGTFCISIHPLDYLSISENTHKWHSCHSLNSDFRSGNLNYMADAATLVCYIKTADSVKLPNFPESVPWNNKKWRVLLFINNSGTFFMTGREYPYDCAPALNLIQEVYNDFCGGAQLLTPWYSEQIHKININNYEYTFSSPKIPVGDSLLSLEEIYQPGYNTHQYNDVLRNPNYRNKANYSYLASDKRFYFSFHRSVQLSEPKLFIPAKVKSNTINVGQEVKCICRNCYNAIDNSDSMLCDKHTLAYMPEELLDPDYFPVCTFCKCRFIHYEGGYDEEGNIYCASCYSNQLD